MKKGKKIYAVVNGQIVEGSFGKPMCLIYIKANKPSRARFVSEVFTNKKDAESRANAVSFETVKPAKAQWYENLLALFKPATKGAK